MSKVKTAKSTKTAPSAKPTTGRNANRKGMTYQKLSASQKMEVIASRKRRGDGAVVAAKLGVTSAYVSNVVTGRIENTRVVNQMYDLVRGRKAKATA